MYLKESSDIDFSRQNEYNGAGGLYDSPLYRWFCRMDAGLKILLILVANDGS